MVEPVFGLTFTRDDNEPRPVIASDMSTIAVIGTAPDATAAFPLDTAVLLRTSDTAGRTALGTTGTLADAIDGIADQLGDFQAAADVIVVRVEEGADAAATIANIVGAEADLSGLYALLAAGPDLGKIPRIIIAPGFTHQIIAPATANAVCAELPAICSRLLAHAIVEGPGTNEAEIKAWRESMQSERLIPIDAWVKVQEGTSIVTRPGAPRIAGLMARVDYEHGGAPMHSAANRPIQGIVGLVRNPAFSLTDGATEGQSLLASNVGIAVRGELGVESAIAGSGFVFIGTDNAADDPIWQFYNVTRGRDYIHLGLLKTFRGYLGRNNITGHAIQAVLNTATSWLTDLQADNHILDFRVGFDADQNSPENLRLGRFAFFFQAEEPPVLRRLDVSSRRYRPALEALVEDLLSTVTPAAVAA